MKDFLIDTNILIKYFRGEHQFIDFFVNEIFRRDFHISFLSIVELLEGVKSKEHKMQVENIKEEFKCNYSSADVNKKALKIYKKHYLNKGLSFIDSIIAATCLENNFILVTENLKDFKFIEGLEVYNLKQAMKL